MHSNQRQIGNNLYANFSRVATVTMESVVHDISISKVRFGELRRLVSLFRVDMLSFL